MPGQFAQIPLLFAQNPAPGGAGSGGAGLLNFLPYLALIGVWFYFLLIRPQQKQERERRSMIDSLKKNDKVLTTAGMYGTVVSVDKDQDKVVIRIDDDRGVRAVFSKSGILRVLDVADAEKATETV